MSRVAVISDSISCIPSELAARYNINIIPAGLVIDRKVYPDMTLSNEQFWKMFHQAKEPITTVAISPQSFYDLFREVGNQTKEIVCILFSRVLSATFSAAESARKTLAEEKAGLNIEILDSRSAAGAEGYIALEAARAAWEGKNRLEVLKAAQEMMPRANFYCCVETLKYLIRCGRAPKLALLGDLMGVKPIISINKETGEVENFGRARGMARAKAELVAMVRRAVGDKPVHLNIHYSDNPGEGEELKRLTESKLNAVEIWTTPYSPVMASQCGPVVAISFYA
jgi:DegV family protein with EDD domain